MGRLENALSGYLAIESFVRVCWCVAAGCSEVRNYPSFSRKTCLQWPATGEFHNSFYIEISEEERAHFSWCIPQWPAAVDSF